jgi:hypothetical protein
MKCTPVKKVRFDEGIWLQRKVGNFLARWTNYSEENVYHG